MAPFGKRRIAGAVKRTLPLVSVAPKGLGSAAPVTKDTGRHGKFNANGERVNGIWMASAAQAQRYRQLLIMEMKGTIDVLRTEVTFPLMVNNHLICKYRADFCYDVIDDRGGVIRSIVEDVKGMETPEFVIKRKIFNAIHLVPLTVIAVKGKARVVDSDGVLREGSAGWMVKHWTDRLPD